ncbi:MAG TPA: tryptophan--tRNA ligase [Alphaproteobacteria bacterium]|jgi:tryptophanyl-tRNA synthetase|nr:tryptophan--tRNA ligase [Alphaproteobacteria bacterium]MDP6269754.1 tryptophan--tRNA ligase [Alphaproteobacteria bacterium]MDP7163835.1 tryptophan--tRNA ligase [Alphaproteobacteria bacterium]MDP7429601.1 tryptophan--tRNA ligase [Alphaproteobacteria bacterium]HJM50364.1 tryptophan--tRNA ligase [Alphaproteobacteria bacterium]
MTVAIPDQRIFSGVQPTGNLHLGNYLGAIRNWARLQGEYECIYCMVDLHAITMPQDPAELRASTREVAASLLAAGIDAGQSIVFNQSQVPAHAELAWVFNCVARLGWLNRMTQFKEKAGKNRDNASAGLYTYPALMAADIMVYKATHVPVGEDQKQHLEFTRDVAQSFNSQFGVECFPLVEPLIFGEATRVMSLRDGASKMSKSEKSEMSRINLTDDADTIAKKIRKARTDTEPLPGEVEGLAGRPEAYNLLGIYASLDDASLADTCRHFAGAQFSAFKEALTELAVAKLAPVTGEMNRLRADPGFVDEVLRDGAERAAALAEPIIREVQDIVGFLRPGARQD